MRQENPVSPPARRPRRRAALALLVAAVAAVLAARPPAQGSFVNFEVQPVRPLAVARVMGHDYLLACNPPDNSVEIYDTVDHAFLQRVPVGLRPVTVVWNPVLSTFYTANFLGDSVTEVSLQPPATAPHPRADVLRTVHVGDEPTDIAFLPDGLSFFTTLSGSSAMAWFHALAMVPVADPLGARIDLKFGLFDPAAPFALNEPRRIALHGPVLVAMGHKGGNSPGYDFDLFTLDFSNGLQTRQGSLGSTNFNFRFGRDGRMYAVGSMARTSVLGELSLSREPTGFVQSHLWVVDDVGKASIRFEDRDLGLDPFGAVVPKAHALAAPTDVELFELGDQVVKVFVAGFSSDRIGVLHPLDAPIGRWPVTYVDLTNPSGNGYGMTGPRAFAMKYPAPGIPGDPGTRLYCFNSLSHSIAVLDPRSETEVARFPLQNDPTPQFIRQGRRFLYSAELSGNGSVSCSSCHVDGRLDALRWNLGDVAGGQGGAVPPELLDGVTFEPPNTATFPKDKGPMMTQSLQGLADHPVLGEARHLLTNAPYHWRGDRSGIAGFNGAFVTLMGAPDIGTPGDPKGISDAEMDAFSDMLFSIMYPPNPEQPLARRFSGDFGTPDRDDGDGALRGLKLFVTAPLSHALAGNRSCVHCHALPAGTNKRIVQSDGPQLLESSALRGLLQKEPFLENDPARVSSTRTAEFGMRHEGERVAGAPETMTTFLLAFQASFAGKFEQLVDVMRFQREYDWGIAPIVGRAWTVDARNLTAQTTAAAFDLSESQVLDANAGLAVLARTGGADRGFYFDVTQSPPVYREAGTATSIDRQTLLAQVRTFADRLILQATEAGSARRLASATGVPAVLTGPAPDTVTLEPMRAQTSWRDVARLAKNWRKGTGPDDFDWRGLKGPGVPAPEPASLRTMRIFQDALIRKAPQSGIVQQRHDPPRRLRVAGNNLRHGARLQLDIPAEPGVAPPYSGSEQVERLVLELFPTGANTLDGRRIWATTAEVDQYQTYVLLLGGPFAPDVNDAFLGNVPEPPPPTAFDPLAWNLYRVKVSNEDGTELDAGWQRLSVQ